MPQQFCLLSRKKIKTICTLQALKVINYIFWIILKKQNTQPPTRFSFWRVEASCGCVWLDSALLLDHNFYNETLVFYAKHYAYLCRQSRRGPTGCGERDVGVLRVLSWQPAVSDPRMMALYLRKPGYWIDWCKKKDPKACKDFKTGNLGVSCPVGFFWFSGTCFSFLPTSPHLFISAIKAWCHDFMYMMCKVVES